MQGTEKISYKRILTVFTVKRISISITIVRVINMGITSMPETNNCITSGFGRKSISPQTSYLCELTKNQVFQCRRETRQVRKAGVASLTMLFLGE